MSKNARQCFWCNRPFITIANGVKIRMKHIRSVEHLIPTALGGSNKPDNKAIACKSCNNTRGMILLYRDHFEKVTQSFHRLGKRSTREEFRTFTISWMKANRKLKKRMAFLRYWQDLEVARLGQSPHRHIKLTLPTKYEVEAKLWKYHRDLASMLGAGLVPFHLAFDIPDSVVYESTFP